MTEYTVIANLKGPRGFTGERGLPGVNATPADEAVAGYVAANGSDTRDALVQDFVERDDTPVQGTTPGYVPGTTIVTNKALNPDFVTRSGGVLVGSTAFDVGTFNIRAFTYTADTGDKSWAIRKTYAADTIINSGAIIVGLQECAYGDTPIGQAQQLVTEINGRGGAQWAVVAGFGVSMWNTIIYRTDAIEVEDVTHGDINTEALVDTQQRGYTMGKFRHIASEQLFIFASTHWQDGTGQSATENRFVNARKLAAAADAYAEGYPVIIAADFNEALAEGSARSELERLGYLSARERATTIVNGDYRSYNQFDPAMNTGESAPRDGAWIDGFHTSIPVAVGEVELVMDFANGTTLPLATPLPSDHQLVKATVTVNSRPRCLSQIAVGQITPGGGAYVYQEKLDGQYVLTIDCKDSTSNATAAYMFGPVDNYAGGRAGIEIGKTYTVIARLKIVEVFYQGGSNPVSRSILVTRGTSSTIAQSAAAPFTFGEHEIRVTFVMPADAPNLTIRLLDGYREGKSHWTYFGIVEGDGTNVPAGGFSGDHRPDGYGSRWGGPRHNSVSELTSLVADWA